MIGWVEQKDNETIEIGLWIFKWIIKEKGVNCATLTIQVIK